MKAQSEARVFKQNAERHKKAYQDSLGKADDLQQNIDRYKRKLEKAQSEVARLQEEIAGLKSSRPGAGRTRRPPPRSPVLCKEPHKAAYGQCQAPATTV